MRGRKCGEYLVFEENCGDRGARQRETALGLASAVSGLSVI
jgi:hypothetical protein